MSYLIFKSLHLIFMVTWFAGLFYIVRLFIYQIEAMDKTEEEKKILLPYLKKIQRPLWYGITWPGMILTWIFGVSMLVDNPQFLKMPYIHIKLSLVFGLTVYHVYCHRIFKQLQTEKRPHGSVFLRYWNEVATLFLFTIVFVIVMKNFLNWMYLGAGLLVLSGLIVWGVIAYKKRRARQS
ncbi:MAG TPA: protoporphyrinogen IX oxidase [Flavobacteriales bacterium]|nr:protoporphyrinogen IX oxidase [Flavobacteriales bacterium]HRE73527.1 CopD family protein [Flavobacteriales bacterium]HRJ36208.1 CopD family protein [Flavobacteriales bacterium]HRJ37339.1 CopD family protein [Flavobacteriales bacterium]